MPFSKIDMQEELFTFLNLFGQDIASLYGIRDFAWAEKEAIQESPVWMAASDMYDYGVTGTPTKDLFPKGHIDGINGHVERFFRAMDTPNMRLYLEGNDNAPPSLAMLAVQSAVARMVLDGGWRHTDYGAGEYGVKNGDMNHLTLAEVALLANMDERSVRNAANPKLSDPLKTETIGKRSLVNPEEANRWLAGRKGFVPTKECDRGTLRPREFNINLTEEIVALIEREARDTGLSFEKVLENKMSQFVGGMPK